MPEVEAARPVDLLSCDREPIHILGAVQSFGFLVAVSKDWLVTRISENASRWLGAEVEEALGAPLSSLFSPAAIHAVRGRLQLLRDVDSVERVFALSLREGGPPFDVAVHVSGASIVIEAEPSAQEGVDSGHLVRSMLSRLHRTTGLEAACQEATRQMRALTGFDRVMLYKFAEDGSGEVIAEARRAGLGSYLGHRFPASDIPAQARTLYERNPLRSVADVDAAPAAVLPRLDANEEPLDLSMSVLRSVSPIHLEYLRNMGVAASLSVSILGDGRLWGLFACHHLEPRRLSTERRTAAELFGQMFSWLREAREREAQAADEAAARALHDRLMSAMAAGEVSLVNVGDFMEEFGGAVTSDGVGVHVDGEIALKGETPTREEFSGLLRRLNLVSRGRALATHELGTFHKPAQDYAERAAGMLAIPISRTPRDWLVFFRREVALTVTWAGDPSKPASPGPNGIRLTPRKSFDAWREVVRGQSHPWSEADLRLAETLRATLLEVVLRLTAAAEQERKTAQERQELLIAELNHRVRNILGLILGLVAQSRGAATTADEFAAVVGGRIQALARAHDQITTSNWGPGSLRDLLAAEGEAYVAPAADRLLLDGPDVLVEPTAFSTLALVFHELVTNAAKYGALCGERGRVEVSWAFDAADRLVIRWKEVGGPPVKPPTRRGFGSTIIQRSIPFDLKGEAEVSYELTGLRARFVLPPEMIRGAPAPAAQRERQARRESEALPEARVSGNVLVVEDSMVIALDAEDIMMSLGAEGVDLAASVAEAFRLIKETTPSFALLDVNLGAETSLPVAERLVALGVPFAFSTGYGDSLELPETLAGALIIKKPYDRETVRAALRAAGA